MIGRSPAGDQGRGGPTPAAATTTVAWQRALAGLELEVRLAELLVADPSRVPDGVRPAWTPPPVEGPVPPALREQAHDLLRRQDEVREELARALERSHQDLDRARRSTPAQRPHGPAYVDVSA
ncbi:hypothetical protein GCM10009641_33850 [Mycobacterium cookii]|uniref:Uncharacterized protein n=1 Tax=Nocardioides furvisabuli TaxID=375542 RepID=A0ABN2WWX7_9ACTN|nr:hypothetical protein [Nocardioides furvisabuli]